MRTSVAKKVIAVACSVALAASMVGVSAVQAVATEIAGILNSQGIVADTVYGVFAGKYAVMGKNGVSNIYQSNGAQVTSFTSGSEFKYYGTLRGGADSSSNEHVGYLYYKGDRWSDEFRMGALYFDGTEILPCEYTGIRIDETDTYLIATKPDYTYEIFTWPSMEKTDLAEIYGSAGGTIVYAKNSAPGSVFVKPASGSEFELDTKGYSVSLVWVSDGQIRVEGSNENGVEKTLSYTIGGTFLCVSDSFLYWNGKYYYGTLDDSGQNTFYAYDDKGNIAFNQICYDDSDWNMQSDYVSRRGYDERAQCDFLEIYEPGKAEYIARFTGTTVDGETEDAVSYEDATSYSMTGNYIVAETWRTIDDDDYIVSYQVLDINGDVKYSLEPTDGSMIGFAYLNYNKYGYMKDAVYYLSYKTEAMSDEGYDESYNSVYFDVSMRQVATADGLDLFPEECEIDGKPLYHEGDFCEAYYEDGTPVMLGGYAVTGIRSTEGQGWKSNPTNSEIGIAWVRSYDTGKYGAVYLDSGDIAIPVEYDAFDDTAQKGTEEVLLKKDGAWYFYSFNEKMDDEPYVDTTVDISGLKLALAKTSFTYNGKAQTLKPSLSLNGQQLEQNVDYELSRNTVKNAGTYKVTATGIGNYSGTTAAVTVKVAKKANTLTVSPTKKTYKLKSVKLKAQRFVIKVKKNVSKGKIGYSVSKAVAKAGVSVTSKGKVTVKKGTKKGKYKIAVASKATTNYKAASKYVTVVVK